MTTHDDILTCIADGRLAIERTVAFSMACTLAKVEAMVREMRPTSEPVTIERGNTADLADLADMRDILDGAGHAPTPDGLRILLDVVAHLDERREEAEVARERLVYIAGSDPGATLAELVSAAVEALDGLHRERDRLASDLRNSYAKRDELADENIALRDEAAKWSREHWRVHGELSILAAELARIDRAIAPLWTGDPSDCIGKRVEAVAKAAHVRAETVDSLYDKIRGRDAQIAALTPGPWVSLLDEEPVGGETVMMREPETGRLWFVRYHSGTEPVAAYLWRRLPAGLLDVPAPTVAP